MSGGLEDDEEVSGTFVCPECAASIVSKRRSNGTQWWAHAPGLDMKALLDSL